MSIFDPTGLPATVDSLNQIASEYPGGLMSVHGVIKTKDGRYAVQWQIVFGDDPDTDSWMRFVNPGGFQPTRKAAIKQELDELKERMTMNIFGTELFPYIQGEMIKGKDVVMTISGVKVEELVNNRGSDKKPVVYFKEKKKGLILNKTNAKAIAALYGAETDDWVGKKITMYAEAGTWFGKSGYAIRIHDRVPAGSNGKKGKAASVEIDEIPFDDVSLEDQALAELIFSEPDQAELFPD